MLVVPVSEVMGWVVTASVEKVLPVLVSVEKVLVVTV